jgi:hypothetical protein
MEQNGIRVKENLPVPLLDLCGEARRWRRDRTYW